MLKPRIIPVLLVLGDGLIKTINFKDPLYIGDPINAVRIFNDKEVDELVVLDVAASANATEPNYDRIKKLAAECRMPFCYGGGVQSADQVERIVGLGAEKVAMSSAFVRDPEILNRAAERVGSQSVVVVADYEKPRFSSTNRVFTINGTTKGELSLIEFCDRAQECGAGELIINSIERDGTGLGYDLNTIDRVFEDTSLPITVVGGAGSYDDIRDLFQRYGTIGAGVGTLFVLRGKYRAVLISYPSRSDKNWILEKQRSSLETNSSKHW